VSGADPPVLVAVQAARKILNIRGIKIDLIIIINLYRIRKPPGFTPGKQEYCGNFEVQGNRLLQNNQSED
jgi:hypothetical protein